MDGKRRSGAASLARVTDGNVAAGDDLGASAATGVAKLGISGKGLAGARRDPRQRFQRNTLDGVAMNAGDFRMRGFARPISSRLIRSGRMVPRLAPSLTKL